MWPATHVRTHPHTHTHTHTHTEHVMHWHWVLCPQFALNILEKRLWGQNLIIKNAVVVAGGCTELIAGPRLIWLQPERPALTEGNAKAQMYSVCEFTGKAEWKKILWAAASAVNLCGSILFITCLLGYATCYSDILQLCVLFNFSKDSVTSDYVTICNDFICHETSVRKPPWKAKLLYEALGQSILLGKTISLKMCPSFQCERVSY